MPSTRSSGPTPDVILFTDGACSGNPGPGGWAAILRHPATDTEKRLSGGESHTTNNRMELMAVIAGLKAIKSSKRWRVQLVSDSEYVINGLREWMHKWAAKGWRRGKEPVKNVELWQELYKLTQQHEMIYEHVCGHAGHPENEECDRMAVAEIARFRK